MITNPHIQVIAVPAPDETLAGAMNISKEREAFLDELMDKYHEETTTYPDALAAISTELNNANELAYVSFYLRAFAESQRMKQDTEGVGRRLSRYNASSV